MASFLLRNILGYVEKSNYAFSSLSESGFIPTSVDFENVEIYGDFKFSSLSESGFIPTLGFHDCLSMRLLEREKGNLRNLVLV